MRQIKAFGLNRADLYQREGRYPPPAGASSILGIEFAGVVTELGQEVIEWSVGDEVLGLTGGVSIGVYWYYTQCDMPYAQGAYAEYISSPQTHIMKKPSHLSWAEAASIPEVFLTGKRRTCVHTCLRRSLEAFQALIFLSNLKQNDDVLIHAGASGVGVAAIQLARVFGALVGRWLLR